MAMAIKHLLEKHGATVKVTETTDDMTKLTHERIPDLRAATKVISPILNVHVVVQDKE